MAKQSNQLFPINKYLGPSNFCDRESETAQLISSMQNGRNTVLMAPRRFGKTGLIHHVFHHLKKSDKKALTIFLDIYAAQSLSDFNSLFLQAVTQAMSKDATSMLETVMKFFGSLRPVVGFDPFTGQPEISLKMEESGVAAKSLAEILRVLDKQGKPVYLAIDEFQQSEQFPENLDAILRTELQKCKNISVIFSGSQQHLLASIFNDPKRPFYASTDFLRLEKIDQDVYALFIQKQFAKAETTISEEDARYILNWCRTHTYYVQVICNKLNALGKKNIKRVDVIDVMMATIREQDAVVSSVRSMLAQNQWQLFEAICKEGSVVNYTAREFLQTHRLPSSAAVVQSIKALEDKEMIYQSGTTPDAGRTIYEPYNVFFANWVIHRRSIS